MLTFMYICFFFSSRRRHTRYWRDWSSDVCSSDLLTPRSPPLSGGRIVSLCGRDPAAARRAARAPVTDVPRGREEAGVTTVLEMGPALVRGSWRLTRSAAAVPVRVAREATALPAAVRAATSAGAAAGRSE